MQISMLIVSLDVMSRICENASSVTASAMAPHVLRENQ